MTLQPPFQLIGYFYTSSFVAANKNFSPENFKIPEINVISRLFPDEKDTHIWSIGLYVGLPDETNSQTVPYDFSVSVMGTFYCSFPEDLSEDDLMHCKKLLYVNGSSILYSSIRDHIRTLTASGPYKPFVLPTHRFDPEEAQNSIKED